MPTLHARWLACLLLACAPGREDDSRFPCGDHGGTCDTATELCIVGGSDKCSTCVPLPTACEDDDTCECIPPGTDPLWGSFACQDPGTCAPVEAGRVLTCNDIQWGCG